MERQECVVLNVTGYDSWPAPEHLQGGAVIPIGKKATVVQPDRQTAEREAVRLAMQHPGDRFAVLQVVGVVEVKEMPAHVTLGGTPVNITTRPVWETQP